MLTSSPNPRYRVQKIYSLQEINYKKKEKEKKKGNINTHEKKEKGNQITTGRARARIVDPEKKEKKKIAL